MGVSAIADTIGKLLTSSKYGLDVEDQNRGFSITFH
jgi:hypothetical protein